GVGLQAAGGKLQALIRACFRLSATSRIKEGPAACGLKPAANSPDNNNCCIKKPDSVVIHKTVGHFKP
ncbi:MAG: hypothetical protein ACK4S0_13435, partial [Sediminibacterium sp.]